MFRILSRGRKGAQEGEEGDEPKQYKKANLGLANKMYYNEELKMWVERGKEEEARAEKAKLSAPPPPSVGSLSAASSTTSLAAMGEAAAAAGGGGAPPASAPVFQRGRSLANRYVQTPAVPTAASSPAPPTASKALLPGMVPGAGSKLPGIPAAAAAAPGGSGPPSFFRPTPAPSEATSDALGGSDMGSVSGLSGLDAASFPNSRCPSQPNFFMPGPAPAAAAAAGAAAAAAAPSSSSATDDTQPLSAGAGGDGSMADSSVTGGACMRTSSGSAAEPRRSSADAGGFGGAPSLRESDTSGSLRLPALSGPSNVSFASWQRPSMPGSPSRLQAASGAGDEGEQQGLQLGQQGSCSADMEADAQAEVSSTVPQVFATIKQEQQQQQQAQEPWAHASSNGNGFYAPGGPGGAAEPTANGTHSLAEQQLGDAGAEQQQQEALASQLSAGWDSRPIKDPFDSSGGAEAGAAGAAGAADWAAGAEAGGGGSYGWEGAAEGGEWQQPVPLQQQEYGVSYDAQQQQQQQQDPLAPPQQGSSWDQQQQQQVSGWEGGWGNGVHGAAAADPEGASGSAAGAPVPEAWQQQQPVQEATDGQQQQAGYYYDSSSYAQQYAADGAAMYQEGQQQYAEQGSAAAAAANAEYYHQPQLQEQYAAEQQQPQQQAAGYYQPQQPQDMGGYAGAGGYYQQAEQQQPVEVLQPVHPQLPGIAVSGQGSGSVTSPTYAHPGSSGSRGSKGRMRHASMPGSPLSHQTSMGALLPPPPRLSGAGLGGGGAAGGGGMGADGQAEAAAVVLSTTAAAGDPSMLTAVRPSSPYARTVSPLSRTSTGVGDVAGASKQSSGGFPIPSPPSHGGVLPHRISSSNMFGVAAAAPAAPGAAGPTPWQPGMPASAAAASSQPQQFMQPGQPHADYPQQQQGKQQLANGYDPAMYGQWQQQQLPGQASGSAPGTEQQQQLSPQQELSGTFAAPPFMPGASLESLPRDAPAPPNSWQPRSSSSKQPSATAGAAGRAHPYDQFIAQALSQVNWRAVHFKQPGKLNKLLPWEEWEMEQALKEEAQQQASGQGGRQSPFWYRQMEFRQKLPEGSTKPSASEPAAMPSHMVSSKQQPAAAAAVSQAAPMAAAAANSTASEQINTAYYAGWQQQAQVAVAEQEAAMMMAPSPITPARAATTGAIGAVAPGGLHTHGAEEPTPTSRFMPAAAFEAGGEQPAADGQQLQQLQEQAADGYWGQSQALQYEQQQQYYGQQQQYAEHYYADQQQQYDMSGWQQQQQPEMPAEAGIALGEQQQHAEEHGVVLPAGHMPATWGSPDAEMLESGPAAAMADQLQLHEYSAAAAEGVADDAWGAADEALELQLGVVATTQPETAAAHDEVLLHAPEVVEAARAARLSTSSLGLESQPSTGRVAAAAAKRIVSEALDNIMRQHAVPEEEADQQAAAAPAAADDGWEGAGVAVLEQQAAAGEASGEGEQQQQLQDAPAAPVSAAWARLAGQFNAAAEAAAALGQLEEGVLQYQQYFVQYGDYLLEALPQPALQQAGLLDDAADSASSPAQQEQQQPGGGVVDAEELDELYEEFGALQLKNDTSAAMFAAMGFDVDALLACVAEA